MTDSTIPDIEFVDVWKTFSGAEAPTLAGLNLRCDPGKINVLIGYSGAGKSVTLRHVLGLTLPDKGDVRVLGKSLERLSNVEMRNLRQNFGMLFQGSALFDSLDVFENVAFPLREHRKKWSEERIEARVHELLEMVNLKNAVKKLPSELSGGMRKRVGLARAIALEPKILLFDEPTTGLDAVTAEMIDDLIVETTRRLGASALIISHDVRAALRMGDVVSMLWQGKIIESGHPNQFMKSKVEVVSHFLRSAGAV